VSTGATRTLALNDATSTTLKGGCFLRDPVGEAPSVVCAIANEGGSAAATYALAMAPAKYGLVVPSGGTVTVTDLMTGASVGSLAGNVTHSGSVAPFDLQVLKLTVA